jgi:alkylhydroperoxidase/carboxymuconolactone decarboxylase family protein YurZ
MSAARLQAAQRPGAAREELMEAIWVAAEMRSAERLAHSTIALAVMDETPE